MPLQLYPLAIGAACVVTSIIGTFFVKPRQPASRSWARSTRAVIVTSILSLIVLYPITSSLIGMGQEYTFGGM